MDLRFVAMITGCMLIGAGAAAYHRADGLFSPARATLASAAPEVPLFMQAGVGAPTPAAWPSSGSVTFYDEMLALRSTLAAAPAQSPRIASVDTSGAPIPPRAGAAPASENSDTVEVVIRDRFGRPIRVERIDRRLLAGGGAYSPPVPPRTYGSQPHGPYGYPYRR
jgi:hypothetical protein